MVPKRAFLVLTGLLLASLTLSAYPSVTYLRHDTTSGGPVFPYGSVITTGDPAPPDPGGSFYTGIFRLKASAVNTKASFDLSKLRFDAVCMDANQVLFTNPSSTSAYGTLHYIEDLTSYTTIGPYTDGPTVMRNNDAARSVRINYLRRLFAEYWDSIRKLPAGVAKAESVAAFQWAVWEIVRDGTTIGGNPANFVPPDMVLDSDVSTDDVYLTNPAGVKTKAQNILNFLTNPANANSAKAHLIVYSPVKALAGGGYERISGQELLTMVPEPGFYGLLGLGLSGLYAVVRRRRA